VPFFISILIGIIIMGFTSSNPAEALDAFFLKPFSNEYFFGNMISGAIPLIFTGLAAVIAFSSSIFNLGLEGQVYAGAVISTFIANSMVGANNLLILTVSIIAAFIAGCAIGSISGFLKSKFSVNELISSLLISYSITFFLDFLLEEVLLDRGSGLIATESISNSLMFERILSPSNLHSGLIIAIVLVIVVYFLLRKTTFGFSSKLTGDSIQFSKYVGINTGLMTVVIMGISGGIAAIGGMVDVFGVHGRVIRGFSIGYGWNGIAISLIARNNPLLVIPAALFFAFLDTGATTGAIFSDITPEISKIIQASIFYFVTASFYFKFNRKGMGK